MKVWLTRKHAERIDGIDLRSYAVGDTIDVSITEARILIAEEWAQPERRMKPRSSRNSRGRRDSDQR
jgi:hypothetical protein